jgi:hypothetical protein
MKQEMTMTCWRNERTKQKLTFHMFLDCPIRGVGFDGADLINSSQGLPSCCERFMLRLLLFYRSAQCCANGFSFSVLSSDMLSFHHSLPSIVRDPWERRRITSDTDPLKSAIHLI